MRIMINYINGDIFDSNCYYLVNPVNTVGVMGKGLAAHFKYKYPDMFEQYKYKCSRGEIKVGKVTIIDNIILFPTKEHWKYPSKLSYIEEGLIDMLRYKKCSIAMPAIGCGLGGLPWDKVKSLIETYYNKEGYLDVYLPDD